ncbi:MAG TPA: hypothetical protein VN132_16765 [Bdellovibrio sp.]|nr:hypothetical protein [Bdellovibrio sp.]
MTQEMIKTRLQEELKNFGLNPAEWSLQKVRSLGYVVQNNIDKSFSLYGTTTFRHRKPIWQSLELHSL